MTFQSSPPEHEQNIGLHALSLSSSAHELYVATLDPTRRDCVAEYTDWLLTALSEIQRALVQIKQREAA